MTFQLCNPDRCFFIPNKHIISEVLFCKRNPLIILHHLN